MKHLFISFALTFGVLTFAGCDNDVSRDPPENTTRSPSAPDNTGRNHPDEPDNNITAGDQSQSQADITISAEIRRAIMKADGMSMNARNIKIITDAGVVTLRGPVRSEKEKADIGALAQNTPGVVRVDNLLEVAPGG